MTLTFLGTRGEIDARSSLHGLHTSLLVSSGRKRVMIDCGRDWLDKAESVHPTAIVLTHAHPDHADGLKNGAPCAVYATAETWRRIGNYPIRERVTIKERRPFKIDALTFEAFPVEHSIRAPAVGYRIDSGRACFFYAPDLVYIRDRKQALSQIQMYVGDGASITRPLIRKRGDALVGHASIRDQLTWCQKEAVPRFAITHCGSEIVKGEESLINQKIQALAANDGVRVLLAHDGLRLVLNRRAKWS